MTSFGFLLRQQGAQLLEGLNDYTKSQVNVMQIGKPIYDKGDRFPLWPERTIN
jgi:hypothetical protein